ncbi:MAG: trehalose-phosphatase [Nitriliruptor sp.]|uniref:trehalose-phosphatase n=1 Tax=Nitriliruptor sp. TaxID=2448056 RepID=UPI0034A0481D
MATDAGAPPDDLEALRRRIGDPRRWTIVLDFDGTLAPIVDHPDDATPAPGAIEAIADLAEVCEVAILSGRALDDLEARMGTVPPNLLLVGGHGNEARRPDGSHEPLTDLDAATATLDRVEADLLATVDTATGWLVERKSTSLAVHHRRVPQAEVAATLPRVREVLAAAADDPPGFVLLGGKAVLELKVSGIDKGLALTWLDGQAADRATGLPDRPPTVPLVLGDDTTDEDAFEVALALGGEAVLIAEEPVSTNARFRLRDPARVVTLLRAVREPLGDEPSSGVVHDAWDG